MKNFLDLSFQRQAFMELVGEDVDALLVLGRGLGFLSFMRQLINFYADEHFLAVILGLEDHFSKAILEEYYKDLPFPPFHWFNEDNNVGKTSKQRTIAYGKGGLFSMSSRLFLLDVLRGVLPANLVSVIILIDSDYNEDGMEAFALNLLKHQNPNVRVKSVSVRPERLAGRLERIMKALFLKEVILYPRFHTLVQSDLQIGDSEHGAIQELKVGLSARQKLMQVCLMDLLNSARHDLLRSHRGLEPSETDKTNGEEEDETFSGGLFDNEVILSDWFENILQSKLERLNRVISVRTKQIIEEIRVLRSLSLNVTRLSPQAYEEQLQLIGSQAGSASDSGSFQFWITDAAQVLHQTNLERLERREIPPKWIALEHLLKEIKEQSTPTMVLIICQDSIVKNILETVLREGSQAACLYSSLDKSGTNSDNIHLPDELKEGERAENDTVVQCIDELDLNLHSWNNIIFYDICLQIVRQVEIYLAILKKQKGNIPKLYHLIYCDSVEEQRYLREIRSEKRAFERLILTKTVMVIPDTVAEATEGTERESSNLEAINAGIFGFGKISKIGKDNNTLSTKKHVIVDLRELRSPLPFALHKNGFIIDPQTISIGDYLLLSSSIPDSRILLAVERKSVSDLVSSLASGRLVDQATALTQAYKHCALLIEFERGRPFSLQTSEYSKIGISTNDVSCKLVLLLLHFPRLRLLWCSNSIVTCQVFGDLIDCLSSDGSNRIDDNHDPLDDNALVAKNARVYNQNVKDALLSLPGITDRNVYVLMNQFQCVRDLLHATKQELQSCMEDPQVDLLYSFLHSTNTSSVK